MKGLEGETFEEFKNSFSYGSRADLTFKFLKNLSPDLAGAAIQEILEAIGHSFDTGDVAELHDLVIRWQVAAYQPPVDAHRMYVYDEAPLTVLAKPLAECKVALMTSSGHFADGDDPEPFGVEAMTQAEAVDRISEFLRETPVMSEIPRDIHPDQLRVRHGGYDIRSAVVDHNVAFPRDALLGAAANGRIGELADPLYSFPGAASQGRLRKQALPGWVDSLHDAEIDVLLLVPV
jgi:D-proline reductase (dithiol) PrdB